MSAPHSRVRYLAFARHRLRLRPKATPTSHGTTTDGRYAPFGVCSMRGGFSLLELLVAVLVVAVGALGVAGLQLASIQNNRGAMQYSVTTSLANDLVERVRANPGADYRIDLGAAPPPFHNCLANDCTSDQLAQFDLAVWKCALGKWREDMTCSGLPEAIRPLTVLPGADATVVDDEGVVTVTVVWGPGGRDAFEIAVHR